MRPSRLQISHHLQRPGASSGSTMCTEEKVVWQKHSSSSPHIARETTPRWFTALRSHKSHKHLLQRTTKGHLTGRHCDNTKSVPGSERDLKPSCLSPKSLTRLDLRRETVSLVKLSMKLLRSTIISPRDSDKEGEPRRSKSCAVQQTRC